MKKRPIVLCIMDGYGLTDRVDGNAVKLANTPNLDDLMAMYPTTTIKACGNAVGLPEGQMGNSEVGHMNMGAGRIIYQELTKITKAIEDGVFFENKALLAACENAKKNDSALHLMGLVSDGGVHSHIGHIFGLLELAKRQGLEKLIKASYKLLGLISYLTAGEPEVRAWTITEGTKAPQAAGKIHTDFERGFIRAEVVNYKDLLECGSLAAAREKGLVGLEGKEYVVQDGDVILFRFNV